jgi:hypothetical protein
MQQLRFLKSNIVAGLNDRLGKNVIEDIVFKIGP